MSWRNRAVQTRHGVWVLNNTPVDYSGYGYDMTWFGTEAYVPGPWGRSVATFGGAADYLRRGVLNWHSEDSQGTITAWIRRTVVGVVHAIWASSDEATTGRYLIFRIGANNLLRIIQNNATGVVGVDGNTVLAASAWYHVAVVSDGSSYSLYVNGLPETLAVINANNGNWLAEVDSRDNITIGVWDTTAPNHYFNGQIAHANYYSVALSRDEINADMRGHS